MAATPGRQLHDVTAPQSDWDLAAHAPALTARLPDLAIEVHARVASTNSLLLERLRGGTVATDLRPTLLVAEHQTAGRGQRGRSWLSAPHASLTFSLALPLAPPSWSGLSLAVGVALADALDPPTVEAPPRIGLKWPNDLWLLDAPGRGRKLGGVLIETVAVGATRFAVIGVGLNLRPLPVAQDFPAGFACLDELLSGLDAPAALWRVALPLVDAVLRFEHAGFAAFAAAWRRRDVLAGQEVQTTDPAAPLGVVEGIDADGALRLRVGAARHALVGGEVTPRSAGA